MNQDLQGDSRSELAALRQRLDNLEAEHRELQRHVSRRPFFCRKFVLSALLVGLVTAVGMLWGQGMSLFIDPNGNVGIGTASPDPNAKLHVSGTSRLSNGTGDSWFPYTDGNSYVSGTNVIFRSNGNTEQMRLTKEGNVKINGALTATSIQTNSGVSLDKKLPIPVGTIMAYGGDTTNPTVKEELKAKGWLPCDGTAYSRSEYPDLASAIGNSFGVSGALFRVPDFRGRFLRGVDQGQGRDPDASSRSSEKGGNAGDRVGSVQDDQFKAHSHTYQYFPGERGDIASGSYWKSKEAQTGTTGGNETRPRNVNVNWIIKGK
jgi:hypothetical protein